jgi:hypothetical protein
VVTPSAVATSTSTPSTTSRSAIARPASRRAPQACAWSSSSASNCALEVEQHGVRAVGRAQLRAALLHEAGGVQPFADAELAEHGVAERQQRLADVEAREGLRFDDDAAQARARRRRRRRAARRAGADDEHVARAPRERGRAFVRWIVGGAVTHGSETKRQRASAAPARRIGAGAGAVAKVRGDACRMVRAGGQPPRSTPACLANACAAG